MDNLPENAIVSDKNLLHRNLPKWPKFLMMGQNTTEGQALDIIRRTDQFFSYPSSNDKDFDQYVKSNLLIIDPFSEYGHFDKKKLSNYFELWNKHWGTVTTDYVHNDHVSSCFIYGPTGWIHPDGRILNQFNVGKWPDVGEILQDLCVIAKTWPFIEASAALYDREQCEPGGQQVVAFRIKDGKVELVDPSKNVFEEYDLSVIKEPVMVFGEYRHNISKEIIKSWRQYISSAVVDAYRDLEAEVHHLRAKNNANPA